MPKISEIECNYGADTYYDDKSSFLYENDIEDVCKYLKTASNSGGFVTNINKLYDQLKGGLVLNGDMLLKDKASRYLDNFDDTIFDSKQDICKNIKNDGFLHMTNEAVDLVGDAENTIMGKIDEIKKLVAEYNNEAVDYYNNHVATLDNPYESEARTLDLEISDENYKIKINGNRYEWISTSSLTAAIKKYNDFIENHYIPARELLDERSSEYDDIASSEFDDYIEDISNSESSSSSLDDDVEDELNNDQNQTFISEPDPDKTYISLPGEKEKNAINNGDVVTIPAGYVYHGEHWWSESNVGGKTWEYVDGYYFNVDDVNHEGFRFTKSQMLNFINQYVEQCDNYDVLGN